MSCFSLKKLEDLVAEEYSGHLSALEIISRDEKLHLFCDLNFCISKFVRAAFKLGINHSTNQI